MTGPRGHEIDEVPGEARERKCLRCRETFQSRHYGERICRKCKNTELSVGRVRRRRLREDAEG